MVRVLLTAYLGTLTCLAVFGIHRLLLLRRHSRRPSRSLPEPRPDPPDLDAAPLPFVTVQLPVFNERYVVRRLLTATCTQEYPRDRFEVQVLDDSTDDTTQRISAAVSRFRNQGLRIVHLHRSRREGFKAGALKAGFSRARGEFLAIFDADFVPGPDFLRRTLEPFADPTVGMVQARWGHLNRNRNLLTRLQAVFLDAHFTIEHAARWRSGLFFNFNGTAGIWRRRCLEDAGGWEADTLTEDLDVSYRAQLAGWRFVYLDDVVAPAELPVEVAAFKSQQHRWAKGSIQTARKLLPRISKAPIPLRRKVEAYLHLTNNTAYLLLLLLAILLVPSLPARLQVDWRHVALLELPLFLLGTISVSAFFLRAQREAGAPRWRRWAFLPGIMTLGIALAVNNGLAVLEALVGDVGEFQRTPKCGLRGTARRPGGYRLRTDRRVVLEVALALYFAGATLWAARNGIYPALPFLTLFMVGFGLMPVLQVAESLGRFRQRVSARPQEAHLKS